MRRLLFATLAVLAAALLALPSIPAIAFDTGPHASITIDALTRAGFNRNAANAVQVENWLTDYYTSSPTMTDKTAQCDLEKLHFDDLFSTAEVSTYWATLAANTKAAVKQAEIHNDAVEFYVVLGVSLHVVQDFYAHSNWVEWNGVTSTQYGTATWFQRSSPPAGLHTGWYSNCLNIPQGSQVPHGGYTDGMNHDSVVRPNYDRAYVYAYAASYEWTNNVLDWIGMDFQKKVKNYNPNLSDANDLAYDQKASIYISEWIQTPDADGHWNGNRSGYVLALAPFAVGWTSSHDSIYVRMFKSTKIYSALSKNLYSGVVMQMPSVTAYLTNGTMFAMRTLSVYANSAITGTDSYYGDFVGLDVGNGMYHYRDASQHHRPRTDVPWLQLTYVPSSQSSINFTYGVWNEWITTNNDQVPIKGLQKTLTFACATSNASCTGDISGGPWTSSSPYTTAGSGTYGIRLQLYFTATPAVAQASTSSTDGQDGLLATAEDCTHFNPNDLNAGPQGSDYLLSQGGSMHMDRFATLADAQNALLVAQHFSQQCFVGRSNTRSDRLRYIMEYWQGSGHGATWPASEDCLAYDPSTTTITQRSNDFFIEEGVSHSMVQLATRSDAKRALMVVRAHKNECFVGRGSGGADREHHVMRYWK
jgi:hypothetical protein